MPMKVSLPRSDFLLDRIKEALTPNRLPLLIAVDGADNAGKSSLASWLAWQLGMPAVQLDLYLTSLRPIQWLAEDLARVVACRLDRDRPLPVYPDKQTILEMVGTSHWCQQPLFLQRQRISEIRSSGVCFTQN